MQQGSKKYGFTGIEKYNYWRVYYAGASGGSSKTNPIPRQHLFGNMKATKIPTILKYDKTSGNTIPLHVHAEISRLRRLVVLVSPK